MASPMNIAALLQSQNLAMLLAALDGGSPGAGQLVEARLLSTEADGTATALVNGVKVALVLAGPEAKQADLQPGARLTLRLDQPAEPGAGLQATLISVRPAPAQATMQPLSQFPTGAASPAAAAAQDTLAATGSAATRQPVDQSASPAVATTIRAETPRSLAGPLLGTALARQDGLAPLFANLGGLAQGSVALMLPRPLLNLIDQLLAQRLPSQPRAVTAETLRAAVASSGIFLEARQAAGDFPTPANDLKAGLQALRDMLQPLMPETGATPLHKAAASAGTEEAALAPPRAAGPLTPQPAEEPGLAAAARPAAIAQALFGQAEAALDRISLSQYASLPPEGARLEQQPVARWLTEIPLALPNGTAVIPLEIERDPPHAGKVDPDAPLWRVRFALDTEPLGALQGIVTLQGRMIAVTFWAEREETSRLLRLATPDLESSLIRAHFEGAELEVLTGHPRPAAAPSGQFLDRRS